MKAAGRAESGNDEGRSAARPANTRERKGEIGMELKRISVKGECTVRCEDHTESFRRWYADGAGLGLFELHSVSSESDFSNGRWLRESPDNGRSWSEPVNVYEDGFERFPGGDEILRHSFEPDIYDPASGNLVTCGMLRYFIGGHEEAYRRLWNEAGDDVRDHCYLIYRRPDGTTGCQLAAYEKDISPEDEKRYSKEYLDHNLAYFSHIHHAKNGDLLFPLAADVRVCCRMLGIPVEEIAPSCPQILRGVLLVRARWNAGTGRYELSYSRPVVISDRLSSRGVCEPCVTQLESGRILIVFRGSNWYSEKWNMRIEPGTPGFKWYTFSDDGGLTFSPAMPWHFDTREVIYSSATISDFFRSSKTGKTYWIGNITDPEKTDGNFPRYPLVIAEVDEKWGTLKKDTLTVIDTRRDGESDKLQLSNFTLLENRETLELELRLTKLGIRPVRGDASAEYTESWTYCIRFGEES